MWFLISEVHSDMVPSVIWYLVIWYLERSQDYWGQNIKRMCSWRMDSHPSERRCRDSILYRLVLAYFTAHDHWASQHNITIMCRVIPHIMCNNAPDSQHFPTLVQCIPAFSHIFVFHCASSRFIMFLVFLMHLCVPSWFSAHHCRSIHPLSSQFLGASHSIYYYIWLCLALYDYYFIMDPYITSLTYLERSWFASEPWEGAYVRLRVAMFVFTT
jgi:hypothetical protein